MTFNMLDIWGDIGPQIFSKHASLIHYIILGSLLFIIGLIGVLIRGRDFVRFLLCLEVSLLGVHLNMIAFATLHQTIHGYIFSIFIMTVAAAEAAIGLSLFMLWYRKKKTLSLDDISQLKG